MRLRYQRHWLYSVGALKVANRDWVDYQARTTIWPSKIKSALAWVAAHFEKAILVLVVHCLLLHAMYGSVDNNGATKGSLGAWPLYNRYR